MKSQSPVPNPVRPLLSEAQMERILSERRSISSEEAYRQIEAHLGRPLRPARRQTFVNGQTVWVSN